MTLFDSNEKFQVGEIIHHCRYGYRGVIVERHSMCRADDAWYERNKTQPRRDQPWYRVLVDGGSTTYVAEENLEADGNRGPIQHPLIRHAFPTYHDGRYFQSSTN